jgi:hypothetical protein
MNAPPREYAISLPIGYTDAARRVHDRALVRKIRGHEEALLYDSSLSSSRLVTELIKGCLLRLGDVTEVSSNLVAQLYSADRNHLVVELRRITLGDTMRASYVCPGCSAETTVTEDLAKMAVRRLQQGVDPENITVTLEDGYQDRDGVVHTEVRLRLPRGADEEFVARVSEKDPLRARDVLILRCIQAFGSVPRAALESFGIKILRDLTLGDRRRLYAAIESEAPGVDFRRPVRCAHCGVAFEAMLEASGFFVPG